MTDYGHLNESNFTLCISTSVNGTSPDGERYFFECQSVNGRKQFLQKITETAGGLSYSSKDGKLKIQVSLQQVNVIKKDSDATVTDTLNNAIDFMDELQDVGKSVAYLWIKNRNDNKDVKFGRVNGTQEIYVRGYISNYDLNINGPTYAFRSIDWVGVSN